MKTTGQTPNPGIPQGSAATPNQQEVVTRLSTIESRVQWASQQMSALVSDVAELKKSLDASEIHSQKMAAANKVLGARVRDLSQELDRQKAAYAELMNTNQELQQIAEGISDAHTSLEKQMADEVAMNRQLQATMQDLETALDDAEEESGTLRRAISMRDEEIDRLTDSLKMAHRNAQRLRDAKAELEKTLDEGDGNRGALLKKVTQKDSQVRKLKDELEEAQANLKLQEHEKIRANETINDLQAEVKRLRAKLLAKG